jgi:flavin-dependent dehydrogenase
VRGVRLAPQGVDALELRFSDAALSLERRTLDALMLDAAVGAGATLVRARVDDVEVANGRACGVVVRNDDGAERTIGARFVVGADGIGSLVGRKLGLVRPARGRARFAIGGHYRGFGALLEYVEMYVGGGTYLALNPLGDGVANVMFVVDGKQLGAWAPDVDAGIRGAAARLTRGARLFESAERIGARMSIGPLDFNVRGVRRPGALLAGDAGGFVNPFTGQGVALALRGGIDAARTIELALDSPANEVNIFAAFERRRLGDLAGRRRVARLVDALLAFAPLTRTVARRLRGDPRLAARMMKLIAGSS